VRVRHGWLFVGHLGWLFLTARLVWRLDTGHPPVGFGVRVFLWEGDTAVVDLLLGPLDVQFGLRRLE